MARGFLSAYKVDFKKEKPRERTHLTPNQERWVERYADQKQEIKKPKPIAVTILLKDSECVEKLNEFYNWLTERNIIFKQKHIFKKVSITIAGKVIDYHKMIYIFNNIDDATNFNIEFNPGVYVRWSKDNRMEDEEDEEDDNF